MYFLKWVYYFNSFCGSHNQFVRESRSVSSAQSSTPVAVGILKARSIWGPLSILILSHSYLFNVNYISVNLLDWED